MLLLKLFIALVLALIIHEMGHILAAKLSQMRVETVKLFFGRSVATWRMWGVQWSLGWLPLGAYTTIPGAFAGRNLLRRASVVAAGPLSSALASMVSTYLLTISLPDPSGFLVGFAMANAVLALFSLSPITGADSPALIGMIADHWFIGTTGRIVIGVLWLALPIGLALLLRSLPSMLAQCW